MEKFDVLVVGSGSGMIVASNAVANGLKTAVVDFGPMGGTCLNRGCIPSKMLIYPVDAMMTFSEAAKIGVHGTVETFDFESMMQRTHDFISHDSESQAKAIEVTPEIKWFKEVGEFVSDYTMKLGSDRLVEADKVFIVSGARPDIPQISGIEKVEYLTNDTVLQLRKRPKNMVIVGGGYVATEYGHFFAGIGTEVTIVQRTSRLLPEEEPEISELLKEEMSKRMNVFTDYEAVEVSERDGIKTVTAKNNIEGSTKQFSGETLLIATGRIPNSDLLRPEKTGVELDKRGYIKVNDFLETTKKNVWAFGDAIGRKMFKHAANAEAQIAWHNSVHDHKVKMESSVIPHAVFVHPQIASVGLKETEAKQMGYKILVGRAFHADTAMGAAMGEPKGFVKVIVEQGTGRILGGHIVGPYASMLIQEITNAMSVGDGTFTPIIRGMHIHPAMSEVVQNAFGSLKEAE